MTKAIAIPLIIKRIAIFLCLLERWKGKAFPGACAPPHKGRGRGPLAGRSRSGRARQWEGPEGAKRPESPGNAFPSTVYSSIHKKESDLSQLDFLVTLFFFAHFRPSGPIHRALIPPPVLVPAPLDAQYCSFLRISVCCSISGCAISPLFAHPHVLVWYTYK